MYECFHCGHRAVIWEADFDFADYGLEGKGIIHICHCTHCGAEIEYYIPIIEEGDDDKVYNSVCTDHEEELAEDTDKPRH